MKILGLEDLRLKFSCSSYENIKNEYMYEFEGIGTLEHADSKQISFYTNKKYYKQALESSSGAILCSQNDAESLIGKTKSLLLVCANPYATFARISQYFFQPQVCFEGISPQSYIDITAKVHPSVVVFPFVFIGAGSVIEEGSLLYAGAFIGAGVHIGKNCILYPHSVVSDGCILREGCILNPGAVIGGDGFGFAPDGMENVKIPQMGNVILDSFVEVGSNSSIDRAAIDSTFIGEQTKIDSLVQIGHNVKIGKACFLCGGVGVAGSAEIGNRVTLAGQVGVSGHLKIEDQVMVCGQSGVQRSLKKGETYCGTPAKIFKEYLDDLKAVSRLVREQNRVKEAL